MIAVVALVILGAFTLNRWELHSGKKALARYKSKLTARGESIDLLAHLPAPVPDDRNFGSAPLIRELFESRARNAKPARIERLNLKGGRFEHLREFRSYAFPLPSDYRVSRRIELRGYLRDKSDSSDGDVPGMILRELEKVKAELAEIGEAALRPVAHFPVEWEQGMAATMPHLQPLENVVETLQVRALAELRTVDAEAAFEDVMTCLRVNRLVGNDPSLINVLTATSMLETALQPVWEGCLTESWSLDHLAAFEKELARFEVLFHARESVRFEKAQFALALTGLAESPNLVDELRGFSSGTGLYRPSIWSKLQSAIYPRGLLYRSVVTHGVALDHLLFAGGSPVAVLEWFHAKNLEQAIDRIARRERSRDALALMSLQGASAAIRRLFRGEAMRQNARIACALERYRIAEGAYPEALSALSPVYLEVLPADVITGAELRYLVRGDGRPAVYSVGIDESDDGGLPREDTMAGDWVWQYSTPEGFEPQDFEKQTDWSRILNVD